MNLFLILGGRCKEGLKTGVTELQPLPPLSSLSEMQTKINPR